MPTYAAGGVTGSLQRRPGTRSSEMRAQHQRTATLKVRKVDFGDCGPRNQANRGTVAIRSTGDSPRTVQETAAAGECGHGAPEGDSSGRTMPVTGVSALKSVNRRRPK